MLYTLTVIGNIFHAYQIFRYTSNIFEDNKLHWYKWIIIILFGCMLDLFDLSNLKSSFMLYIFDIVALNLILNLMFNSEKYLKIFIAGNIVLYFLAIRGTMLSLMSAILDRNFYDIITNNQYHDFWGFVTIIVLVITFPIFSKMYSFKKLKMIKIKELRPILFFQYISILMLVISSVPYYYNLGFVWINFYNGFNHILCILLNYIIFMYVYIRGEKVEYEIKSSLFESQLNYSLLNYNNKVYYIEKLRAFKHDYKGIMRAANIFIDNNDTEKLKSLLREVDCNFNNIESMYEEFSNNILLQAIMSSFHNKCMEKQIEFEGKIFLPETIALTDYEKCRIFHNLLNNAFEACNYNLNGNKKNYIKICSSISNSWFIMIIENTFDGYLKKTNNRFLSRKDDNVEHGFGVKSVTEIVESKNGFINIENDNAVFKVTLNIPI